MAETVGPMARATTFSRRLFDVTMRAAALLLLLAVLPFLLMVGGALIACGRNPLFRQVRVGLHDRPFTMVKLRTVDCHRARRRPTRWRDKAFASLARWLRRKRLDELPQLGNIVLGHMVFVGPRPLVATDLLQMGPERTKRHAVKPGLTGLAQLSGGNLLSPESKLQVDLHYIERRSIRFDARILLSTIPRVVEGIDAAQLRL